MSARADLCGEGAIRNDRPYRDLNHRPSILQNERVESSVIAQDKIGKEKKNRHQELQTAENRTASRLSAWSRYKSLERSGDGCVGGGQVNSAGLRVERHRASAILGGEILNYLVSVIPDTLNNRERSHASSSRIRSRL